MAAEIIYLISIWTIQAILYIFLSFKLVKWKIRKSTIFWNAVLLFLISPWFFPVDGGYNPDTGEYICGLASLIPISIFWILGNIGNLTLILVFVAIGLIRKKIKWPASYIG